MEKQSREMLHSEVCGLSTKTETLFLERLLHFFLKFHLNVVRKEIILSATDPEFEAEISATDSKSCTKKAKTLHI